jgi:hypothetical protein
MPVKSPSKYMLILGRTDANRTGQDYEIVNGLPAQYELTPLSAWGKDYTDKAGQRFLVGHDVRN